MHRRSKPGSWVVARRAALAVCLLLSLVYVTPSRAQDPQQIMRQFLELMKEAQRASEQRKRQREANPAPQVSSASYKVGGIELGQTIDLSSDPYRNYSCNPSEGYTGFTSCKQAQRK